MDLYKPARRGRAAMPVLSVAAVVAVLVAGCGGSSTPTTTTKHVAKKVSTGMPKTSTASAPTTVADTTVSTASSSSGTPSFASASNCTALSGVGEQFAKAMESATSGGKFNLDAAVKAYQNLANAAPSAIKPDIQELASAFTAYASVLSKANYKFGTVPSASQITAIESAAKDLSASKLETASKALEAWAVKNCTG